MSLCIITPIKEAVQGPCHASVVGLAIDLTRQGVTVHHRTSWQCSLLPLARNLLLQEALKTGAERVLFVDDDVVFDAEAAMALLATDVDLVSGLYVTRDGRGTAVGHPLEDGERRGPLLEMQSIGLGFALATRSCLDRLVSKHGDGVFEVRHDGKDTVGEDVTFCDRWREIGGRVWLHTGVRLGHIGPQVFR